MLTWAERRVFDYSPPDDHPPPPAAPRGSWTATGQDGALLEAFRWGSPLGEPFVLEVRRHGAPLPASNAELHELAQAAGVAHEGDGTRLGKDVRGAAAYLRTPEEADAAGFAFHPWPKLAPAELPTLAELQSAADQLVPLGVVLALGVVSNGSEATYPEAASFRAVRMIQAGAFVPGRRPM